MFSYTTFAVNAGAPGVQVLDGFVGTFKFDGVSSAEWSFDGSTYFAGSNMPWAQQGGVKVSAPVSLWVKNVHHINNDTGRLLTWY